MPGKGVRSLACCPACADRAAGQGMAPAKQPPEAASLRMIIPEKETRATLKEVIKLILKTFNGGKVFIFAAS